MKFTKTLFALAIGSVGIMGAMSAHAVALNTGDILTITPGTGTVTPISFTPTGGSYFYMLGAGGALVNPGSAAGVVIGQTQAVGEISNWTFSGAAGQDYTTKGVTGDTTTGLDFTGWYVSYNGAAIPMGAGAWNSPDLSSLDYVPNGNTFNEGKANFAWDGTYGHTYKLTYHGTVPSNVQGFANIQYDLNLTGTVMAAPPVPEASTYGMMLAGLGLVGFAVRRRRVA